MVVALWLPWFELHLSSVFAPVRAARSISGWAALGGLGPVMLALAVVALAWGIVGSVPRWSSAGHPSPFWLVATAGLALVIDVETAAARVGVEDVTTTTPSIGLALAVAGALVVVLAGIGALVAEARTRTRAG